MKKILLLSVVALALGCNKTENGDMDVSVLQSKFNSGNTTFTINDDEIVITTVCVPDHVSAYFNTSLGSYEAYTDPSFVQNPNTITSQNITMTIPRYPNEASSHESTPFGAMGVAVNSVALFNQYAAGGADVAAEIPTFDQWQGHPQDQGTYHYHLEPTWLTSVNGNEALVGILLDGFPVYGTHENGVEVTNNDLDEYHGHTSATPDFPNGIYHYHITAADPYINGSGFYGTAGTISQ